jgi:hypothetical protein
VATSVVPLDSTTAPLNTPPLTTMLPASNRFGPCSDCSRWPAAVPGPFLMIALATAPKVPVSEWLSAKPPDTSRSASGLPVTSATSSVVAPPGVLLPTWICTLPLIVLVAVIREGTAPVTGTVPRIWNAW